MSGIKQFIAQRWHFGILSPRISHDDLVSALNQRLGNLTEIFGQVHASAENGPVPGAYLPIPLYCDTPAILDGVAYSYMPQVSQGLRIIGCSLSISDQSDTSASLDVEVEYKDSVSGAWASVLTSTPKTVTAASPVQLNSAGDFVLSYFSASGYRLNVTAMTNIPKGLMVLLWAKNAGKIEPVVS